MTSNDIAYYKAQNDRRNMRLQRKETKRHNLAQERAQALSAEANYLGAQASGLSAQAAQQQAATAQKRYELDWEGAYGMPYGKDPNDMSNYTVTKNTITGQEGWTTVYMEPSTYYQRNAESLEKLNKSAYEIAGTEKLKTETAYGQVKIIREGIGTLNDTVNLGSKVANIWNSHQTPSQAYSELSGSVPGTDLIIYGGQ